MILTTEQFRVSSWLPKDRVGNYEVRACSDDLESTELVEWVGAEVRTPCWMDDRANELEAHRAFIEQAHGHILVTGLGLAAVQVALARNPLVESVHTIELSQDVIDLVWFRTRLLPPEVHEKRTCVHADANTWRPQPWHRLTYDFGYFDHTIAPMTEAEQAVIRGKYSWLCREIQFWQKAGVTCVS